MLKILITLKTYYLQLKKNYFSFVLINQKNFYYSHQTINYIEQNIYGVIHNSISALWLLIFFTFLLKDIIYFYLIIFILLFNLLLYVMITFCPKVIPKTILTEILSLSYFYKAETELMNTIIYVLFLGLICLALFFGFNTYFFIRLLFFFRCFLSFTSFFYQSLPNLQMQTLKNSLIIDTAVLNLLHPMEKIDIKDFLTLKIKEPDTEENIKDYLKLLERYNHIKHYSIKQLNLEYEREVINKRIIIYDFKDSINGLINLFDNLERDLKLNPSMFSLKLKEKD